MFVNGQWLNLDVAGLAIKSHQFQRLGTLSPFWREERSGETKFGWLRPGMRGKGVVSNFKNDRVVMRLSHVSLVSGPWRRDVIGGTREADHVLE